MRLPPRRAGRPARLTPNPPLISTTKCYNVPGPTHTVTFTPTFTGEETATSTPTHLPPHLILPENGAEVSGTVRLVWTIPSRLQAHEVYAVQVVNESTGDVIFYTDTRIPNITLPQELEPASGESLPILWSVEIATRQPNGLLVPVSGRSVNGRFTWQKP